MFPPHADAAVFNNLGFYGAFTLLNAKGGIAYNSDVGGCYDMANALSTNQCARTAVSGSFSFDMTTGDQLWNLHVPQRAGEAILERCELPSSTTIGTPASHGSISDVMPECGKESR